MPMYYTVTMYYTVCVVFKSVQYFPAVWAPNDWLNIDHKALQTRSLLRIQMQTLVWLHFAQALLWATQIVIYFSY